MDHGKILEAAKETRRQLSAMAALRADEMGAAEMDAAGKAAAQLAAIRGVSVEELEDGAAWAAGKKAAAGACALYGGKTYSCLQAHVTQPGWEPPAVPALWAEKREDFAPWVQPSGAHNAYAAGALVTHAGKKWQNTYGDGNVWTPGVFGWTEVQ